MEVQFTPDQEAFIRQAIETGRLHREEDAMQQAMSLWKARAASIGILAAVDQAEASLARGEGRVILKNPCASSPRRLSGAVVPALHPNDKFP